MNYILFDTAARQQLLPFAHTRLVADIRCGIMTMRKRWEVLLGTKTSSFCPEYLQNVFAIKIEAENIFVNGSIFANEQLVKAINLLQNGQKLVFKNKLIAFCSNDCSDYSFDNFEEKISGFKCVEYSESVNSLEHIWDIFLLNEMAIKADFELLTKGRTSQLIPAFVTAIAPENVFIEEGANVNPCIINASKGPIYIGKNAEIMEGCMLRGAIALGENAVLKMGAKIYGATTIGEGCKVGGEVSNAVFFSNSNKGHDGFIGNAVIGEWCNLGADTNCSNIKKNYDEIKIWSESDKKLVATGLQFCGLMMGDHSKSGINSMFNTATVVGVSSNIFGSNFPEKFIPSFSWGAATEIATYEFEKAMDTANRMMNRRGLSLSEAEKKMYQYIFEKR